MTHSTPTPNPFERGYLSFEIRRVARAHAIVQSVCGKRCDGSYTHVGDSYTYQAAQAVVRNLQFETGFYSRCWEISNAHLTEDARQYLDGLIDQWVPPEHLFIPFRIPHCPAIGVKLIGTPWTDKNLGYFEGITTERLRAEQRRKGMPDCLIEVLHLAALADVRILIFDADAPRLSGLPVFS